jgi:hypothetical protein
LISTSWVSSTTSVSHHTQCSFDISLYVLITQMHKQNASKSKPTDLSNFKEYVWIEKINTHTEVL